VSRQRRRTLPLVALKSNTHYDVKNVRQRAKTSTVATNLPEQIVVGFAAAHMLYRKKIDSELFDQPLIRETPRNESLMETII
jgi:hypothetical protein